jgi:equilibrative nucleoside transporter 1/2/3
VFQSITLGDWYPIVLITLFNIADFMGKNLPFCGWQPSQKQLLVAAVARLLIFLPSFVAATALGLHAAVVGLLTFALGLSNG